MEVFEAEFDVVEPSAQQMKLHSNFQVSEYIFVRFLRENVRIYVDTL